MILIACVDEKNGMLFSGKRQSRDKILMQHIIEKTKNSKLYINSFSKNLFDTYEKDSIIIDDNPIKNINENDYYFIENIQPSIFLDKVNKIILYSWNRHYPADQYFDISLDEWVVESQYDFIGSSHDKITERIYIRGIK